MAYIAIIDLGYKSYDYEEDIFTRHGYELKFYKGDSRDISAKIDFVIEADGILVRDTPIDKDFFKKARNLRAIVRYGVGYDNIDLTTATHYGVKVANVQGYANHCVSDHALAMIYACIRGLPEGEKNVLTSFGKPPFQEVFELHNKTLGIIGLGRIGGTLSDKARYLFQKVLAVDPYIQDEKFIRHGAEKTDMDTLLKESHVISLHCNLTDETRHIIDRFSIRKMEKCPVLINTARGPVLDEETLPDALDDNLIHSAGIDVYENEPVDRRQEKLISHPRIITTGHYAWYSATSLKELQKRAADNMIALLQGNMVDDCLNP
jgi:D-3-phosphoglycerate dehydrogenase